MARGVDTIEDILAEFRDEIDTKTIEDYSALFLTLKKYLDKKRKRDFRKIPDFLLELDTTLEDIVEHLGRKRSIIKDQNVVRLIKAASNLGTSISVMSDDTMMSTDPVFFDRVLSLKEQIRKISKAMNSIMIILGTSDYVIAQSNTLCDNIVHYSLHGTSYYNALHQCLM